MGRGNFISILVLAAIVMIFPFLSADSYNISIGIFSGINALIAIGLCVLMGYAGQVSLGQAGFYGIGAYVSATLSLKLGVPVILSIMLGMIVSSVAAVILAIPALRLKGHYLAVATLGFGEIIYIMLNEWGSGGPSGFGDIPGFSLFGFKLTTSTQYFYLVWFFVILVIIFSFNIVNSRIGRAMRSIHDSETGSSAVGVDVSALKTGVFILSAIYASLAGSLYAHYVTFLSPSTFSLFHSVLVLMMVVLGGVTNLWGGVVGAVIITVLPEALRQFEELDVLVYGLILTLSLLFLRKGIVPIIVDRIKRERKN